jgi:transposase
MKVWLEMQLGRVPPASPLAEAIRYALARWPVLTRFLDDSPSHGSETSCSA